MGWTICRCWLPSHLKWDCNFDADFGWYLHLVWRGNLNNKEYCYACIFISDNYTMGSEDGDDHENYPDGNNSLEGGIFSKIVLKERKKERERSLTQWWANSPWKNWKQLLGSLHFHNFHSFVNSQSKCYH